MSTMYYWERFYKMNIYIFMEIKRRELSSRMLLAFEAAFRGNDVYIGDLESYFKRNLFKPGLVHFKSLSPTKNRLLQLKNFKSKNFICTSQDEESGHINDNLKEYVHSRYNKESIKYVDAIFTWGKLDYDNLKRTYPQYKTKLINTGNPRIDFWRSDFSNFYDKKEKNFILISSNFETICGHRNFAENILWLRKLGYFDRGRTFIEYLDRATKEYIIFNHFVKLIKKISLIYKDKKILFRPHPVEKIEDWKKIFFENKNVIVDNSDEIGHSISAASVIIHNGCTGGLEASLRGKKVIAFAPKSLNIGHELPNKTSIITKTDNQVLKHLKSEPIKKLNKIIKGEINNRLINYFGKKSYIQIVDHWEFLGSKLPKVKNNKSKLIFLTNLLKFKLKIKKYKDTNYKFSDFSKKEIEELKKNLINYDKKFKKIKIEYLAGRLLRIHT